MKINSVIIRNKLAGFSMLALAESGLFDPHGFQFDGLFGLVIGSARPLRNFRGEVHAFDDLPEDGVLVVEPGRTRARDERTAPPRAGPGVGHGQLPGLVVAQILMELVAKAVAWIAGTRSKGTSALNHELRNHAMENKAVVKRALHFLPRLRVLEFLGALGQADEIPDRLRRFLFEQADDDRPLRSIEYGICAWCAAQDHLLWMAKCAGIITHSGQGGQRCPQ